MDFELVNVSVVILAEATNPAILHESFLKASSIVPNEWAVRDLVTTQVVSKVEFMNGVIFVHQQEKIEIAKRSISNLKNPEELIALSTKYINALGQFAPKAVGINLVGFEETQTATDYLLDNFVPDKVRDSLSTQLQGYSFNIVLAFDNMRTTVTFDTGNVTKSVDGSTESRDGMLYRSNYHLDVTNVDEVLDTVSKLDQIIQDFSSVVGMIRK